MSRNRPYDSGESRRSPRDRSPAPSRYNDSRDSGQQRSAAYRSSDGQPRASTDLRLNTNAFASERDNFREPINRHVSRDFSTGSGPPRAPKGFPDAPTGPRASIFQGDTRGRVGRARGRSWHDDARDRGRDVDYDYRDRRDDRGAPPFRGDRGRDRDWIDRDRRDWDGSGFRGRRPSSPGSGYIRGRGRGRGEWDTRGHGRGYDDRDRFRGRSRSPPSRRASLASPPPQAPIVPAFGSVVSHLPTPSGIMGDSQVSPTAPVTIPTGPRSQLHQPLVKGRTPQTRGGVNKHTSTAQWVNPPSVAPQDPPSVPKPPRSAAIAALVRNKTVESTHIPPIILTLETNAGVLRHSLPRDTSLEEEDSDSESGEDMDDFFEAETRKVQDQLAQTSLGDVDRSLSYAPQDAVFNPLLEPPEELSADGNELEEPKAPVVTSAHTSPKPVAVVPKPRSVMEIDRSDGEETKAEQEEELVTVRSQMKTPPVSSLAFVPLTPWWEDADFLQDMDDAANHQQILEQEVAEKSQRQKEYNQQLRREYTIHYEQYLKFCESDDPAAVKYRAKVAASQKAASRAASVTPAAESRPEGRRAASRFATEHDIARVLQESKREAQEKQERSERAAKAKAASEKEAVIPDMMPREDRELFRFADTSNLVPFERAPAILGILPPVDNFTEEECETFERTYLEFPKQWSKIAGALPRRDYKNCIQHYYLVKHRDCLKEKLKKKEKGKKRGKASGPGSKPKSNALMANLGPRDGEVDDGQDAVDGGGERRRPRRAAAPIWPFEAPSESETTTPAPTPGRRTTATTKGDTGSETGLSKRKGKSTSTREKGAKQAKNGQLLAAAPSAASRTRDEDKGSPSAPLTERLQSRVPSDPGRFVGQWDGTSESPISYPIPRATQDLPTAQVAGVVDKMLQVYPDQEYMDSSQSGVVFDVQQQDRRNPQTSSYWSVPEQTEFPALLHHFGTDWQAIAKYMGSKTHTMVKNYYQRQIESGRFDLENTAGTADGRRARGESTGPLPTQTNPVKRRPEGPTGTLQRASGPTVEKLEDSLPTAQTMVMPHASSPQQPPISRFPALAQASPVPQTAQPPHPTSIVSKPIQNQQPAQQWAQQALQNRPRGPPLGYFNPDKERPILQAVTTQHQPPSMPLSDPHRSQRSHVVAHEVQMERQQALGLEEQQARQQKLRLKQETETPNLNQYEQYSAPAQQPNVIAQSRTEDSPIYGGDIRRTTPAQPYASRSTQNVRDMAVENVGTGSLGRISNQTPHIVRTTMSAPSSRLETPAAPRSQPLAVSTARQQETVRKTSSIMSLLNDEPSEPRVPQTKQNVDVQSAVARPSPSPAPQQPTYQPARSLSGGQPSQNRRKTSLGDVHNPSQSYPRSVGTSQGPMRVIEVPYPAALQSQSQSRSQIGSPMESPSTSERETYTHQQYNMQRQQQAAVNSPQLGPLYHTQQSQQPNHRQLAFPASSKRTDSPPGQYGPLHPPRHNSFDGHYSHHVTTPSVPPQMHYSPVGGGPSAPISYQAPPPTHHPLSSIHFATHAAVTTSQAQSQMTQQLSSQLQQPSQHAYPPLPPQSLQHHTQSTGTARSFSPSPYDTRDNFRAAPQQQLSGLDRLNPEQQQTMLRQQMQQQQQQQQQQHNKEAYQRLMEERRYEDSRRR